MTKYASYDKAMAALAAQNQHGYSRAPLVGASPKRTKIRSMQMAVRSGGTARIPLRVQRYGRKAKRRQLQRWKYGATRQKQYRGMPMAYGPVVFDPSYGEKLVSAGRYDQAEGALAAELTSGVMTGFLSGPSLGSNYSSSSLAGMLAGDGILGTGASPGKLLGGWVLSFLITYGIIEVLPPYMAAKLSSSDERVRGRVKFKISAIVAAGATIVNQIVFPLMAQE